MHERTRRRLLAAASGSTAVVLAMALAACGADDAPDPFTDQRVGAMENYAVGVDFKASQPVTFSILINDHPGYPFQEDWPFWQWLTEKTNVSFDFTPAPLSDFNTKRTALITGGNPPQLLTRFYPPQENEFIDSGALLPVSDYVDLLPNYSQRVADWDMASDLLTRTQADGKYYVLSGLHQEKYVEYSFAVRSDLLKKYHLSTPETLDDFHDMLVALKAECAGKANCYPLSDLFNQSPADRPGGNLIRTIAWAEGGALGGWDYDTVQWNYDKGEYELAATSAAYKKTLEFLNTLVKEGLLDPESFTQTDDQARQKLAQGQSFVISSNPQTIVNNYRNDVQGIAGADMELIPIPIGDFGPKVRGGRLENGIALAASVKDSPNFVALMQFIDWLFYSDNGQEFAKWGKEGETFTKAADGTRTLKAPITMLGKNPVPEGGVSNSLQIDYGVYNGAFVYGGTADLMHSFYSDEQNAFLQATLPGREILPNPPPAPLDADQTEEATFIRTPLTSLVQAETLKFILGQRPLSEWDAFVKQVDDAQGPEYLQIIKDAQATFAGGN